MSAAHRTIGHQPSNDFSTRHCHVGVHSLTFTGEDTAMTTLLLSVMGAFAEFERALMACP